jgi:glycine C-acetyltransferase
MLMKDSSLVQRIADNTQRFRSQMTKAGFTISGEDHPICPVMLGDAKLASGMADDMLGNP